MCSVNMEMFWIFQTDINAILLTVPQYNAAHNQQVSACYYTPLTAPMFILEGEKID